MVTNSETFAELRLMKGANSIDCWTLTLPARSSDIVDLVSNFDEDSTYVFAVYVDGREVSVTPVLDEDHCERLARQFVRAHKKNAQRA